MMGILIPILILLAFWWTYGTGAFLLVVAFGALYAGVKFSQRFSRSQRYHASQTAYGIFFTVSAAGTVLTLALYFMGLL